MTKKKQKVELDEKEVIDWIATRFRGSMDKHIKIFRKVLKDLKNGIVRLEYTSHWWYFDDIDKAYSDIDNIAKVYSDEELLCLAARLLRNELYNYRDPEFTVRPYFLWHYDIVTDIVYYKKFLEPYERRFAILDELYNEAMAFCNHIENGKSWESFSFEDYKWLFKDRPFWFNK